MKHRQAVGFTLLEILLATAILGLILSLFCSIVISTQRFCWTLSFEMSVKRQTSMTIKTICDDLEYLAADQMYPLNPENSSYLEFKKLLACTEEGRSVWGPKIRWEFCPVANQNTGQLIRTQYSDDGLSVIESKVVAQDVLKNDPTTGGKGFSFNKEPAKKLLKINLILQKNDGKGFTVRAAHTLALRLQ